VNAIIQAISSGLFPVLSLASLPFILIFYLAISSIALFIGSVLAWPFRWTLRIHAVSGVMVLVTGLMALGGPSQVNFFPLAIAMALSPLSSVLALWQERRLYSSENYNAGAPTGTGGVPSHTTGGYDDDKTVVVQQSTADFLPLELSGKYSEISFIGMGGLARVYKAINNRSGEYVALKIPIHFNEATGRSFMKEIVAWEGLHHKNIVMVSEVNILPIPYVEMEYVDRTLTDLELPLDETDAVYIVAGIAEGLAYAHSKGIIHRDIKPQNILLTADGIPKITDWGMSKILGTAVVPTITGFSLSYAAPEQVSPDGFGETDQRTDIYQLGTVFYELVTGTQLYSGDDIGKVSARIISEPPPQPSLKNPAIKDLDRIILKCLEKRPENRYQSVTDLLTDLSAVLSLRRNHDQYEIFED
jgi:Serine/threonine protein kinase